MNSNITQMMGSNNMINMNGNYFIKEEKVYKDSKIVTLIITGMKEKPCETGL